MHHEKAYHTAFDLRMALAKLHALRTTACAHGLLANMHMLQGNLLHQLLIRATLSYAGERSDAPGSGQGHAQVQAR